MDPIMLIGFKQIKSRWFRLFYLFLYYSQFKTDSLRFYQILSSMDWFKGTFTEQKKTKNASKNNGFRLRFSHQNPSMDLKTPKLDGKKTMISQF